jgi:hypothetical protein
MQATDRYILHAGSEEFRGNFRQVIQSAGRNRNCGYFEYEAGMWVILPG